MKNMIKKESGVTMVALVITVIILLILTSMLVYNATDSVHIKALTNLYNDVELLREKVSEYYNEYGKIPAKVKYKNTDELSSVLSSKNDTGDFYVIDLEAMKGITLNYGKDYEKIKSDEQNADKYTDKYTDIYIINENSQNIFYVQGIKITQNNTTKTYYTDYTEPDETTVDLRYIDGILIPENYYYIGTTKDESGNESLVISNNKEDEVNTTRTNQYIWTKQISEIEQKPSSVTLEEKQKEDEFIKSVNTYKGYFKNSEGKVQYVKIDEAKWSEAYTKDTQYTDSKGDTITIPKDCKISLAQTMNIVSQGFVIKDQNDNEWVWVVVPEKIFKTARSDTDYDNIKADLIEYVKDYRKGGSIQNCNWDDEWYDGCGLTKDEYEKNYQKMLSSVFSNYGFWISRYDIGDSTATEKNTIRTSRSGISGKAVSQVNMIPYNYVTCSDSQTLASKMSPDSSKTSSLLFGIQWDLICKFLEKYSELTYYDIATDSKSWGNYSNSSLKLIRGKYNTVFAGDKWIDYKVDTDNYVINSNTLNNDSYAQLLTTGASEQTRKLNIYDFAGNLYKYTLENTYNVNCAIRSGRYGLKGNFSAAFRNQNPGNRADSIGFRTTLY